MTRRMAYVVTAVWASLVLLHQVACDHLTRDIAPVPIYRRDIVQQRRTPPPSGPAYKFRVAYEGEHCPDIAVFSWGLDEPVTRPLSLGVCYPGSELTCKTNGDNQRCGVEAHAFWRSEQRPVTVTLYEGGALVMSSTCLWARGGGTCQLGLWTSGGTR